MSIARPGIVVDEENFNHDDTKDSTEEFDGMNRIDGKWKRRGVCRSYTFLIQSIPFSSCLKLSYVVPVVSSWLVLSTGLAGRPAVAGMRGRETRAQPGGLVSRESIPEWIRTTNLRLRRPTRYPVAPPGRIVVFAFCGASITKIRLSTTYALASPEFYPSLSPVARNRSRNAGQQVIAIDGVVFCVVSESDQSPVACLRFVPLTRARLSSGCRHGCCYAVPFLFRSPIRYTASSSAWPVGINGLATGWLWGCHSELREVAPSSTADELRLRPRYDRNGFKSLVRRRCLS